jgi:nucleoside-diphosphate-sugar epimerase
MLAKQLADAKFDGYGVAPKILVTGAYGFIAGYTAKLLKEKGYYVLGTAHHLAEKPDYFDEIYITDMRDKAGMYGAIEKTDGVIHLAGLLGTTENIRQAEVMADVNIRGALNVLNACENFKIPLTMIAVGNHFENNCYSITKTTAERFGLMYAKYLGAKVNVVRALNAIGAKQKYGHIKKIVPTFIMSALKGEPIYVYGGREHCSDMDLIWVGDIARVLVDVLERTITGEINGELFEAGMGYGFRVWEIAEKIVKLCGSSSEIIEVPMRAGESNNSRVISDNPYFTDNRDIDDVLKEAVEYYKTQV